MSDLATKLDALRSAIEETDAKILIFDIERMKGQASIDFWDLGDYKGRRISADDVTQWPRTICVAWSWMGKEDIYFAAEWSRGGSEKMLRDIWKALDEADIVVGHNVAGFDIKKLNSEFRDLGLTPPRPYKVVDTLKEARKHFGDESKTLDALNKRIGVSAKTDKYNVDIARAACDGDKIAQATIRSYNEGDIVASEALYLSLLPWMSTHPHLGQFGEEKRCNKCGSDDLRLDSKTFKANLLEYALYECNVCHGWVRAGWVARSATTRGVK